MTRTRQPWRSVRRLSRAGGFSLVEVMVAALLMLVILAAIYGIWFGLQRTYSFTDEDMRAQTEARGAMGEMVELIRTAREPDDPTLAAELDMVIVRAEPNSLVVWTDMDRDINHDLELVRFRVDSNPEARVLYRDDSQEGDPVFPADSSTSTRLVGSWVSNSDEVGKWLFTYLGRNGATLPMTVGTAGDPTHVIDPSKIREVHITLMVDVVMGKSPEHHELRSVVQPRNMRTY